MEASLFIIDPLSLILRLSTSLSLPCENAATITLDIPNNTVDDDNAMIRDVKIVVRLPEKFETPGYANWPRQLRQMLAEKLHVMGVVNSVSCRDAMLQSLEALRIPEIRTLVPGSRFHRMPVDRRSLQLLTGPALGLMYQIRADMARVGDEDVWEFAMKQVGAVDMFMAYEAVEDQADSEELNILLWNVAATTADVDDGANVVFQAKNILWNQPASVLVIFSPGPFSLDDARQMCGQMTMFNEYHISTGWRGGIWMLWKTEEVKVKVIRQDETEFHALVVDFPDNL